MADTNRERVAVVTGVSRGIGKAVTQTLLGRGYRVAGFARNATALDQLRDELDPEGDRLLPVVCDVQRGEQVGSAIDKVVGAWGRIDVLIHNAGAGYWGEIAGCTEEDWDRAFDTNVKGAFLLVQAALPTMERQAAGQIVVVSSMAQRAEGALEAPFSASKRGLQGFAKALGLELREKGIGVTVIAPGSLNTAGFVPVGVKNQPWYGIPALDFASLIVETLERSPNVWVREIEVTHLGGEVEGRDGVDYGRKLREHEAEFLVPARRPIAPRRTRWTNTAMVDGHNREAPRFAIDLGTADAPTPKHEVFRQLRAARDHMLGRCVFVGEEPARNPDLLESVIYGRHQGVRRFGIRTSGRGLDERFLMRELTRHGLDTWHLHTVDGGGFGTGDAESRSLHTALEHLAEIPGSSVTVHHPIRIDDIATLPDAVSAFVDLRQTFPFVSGFIAEIRPPGADDERWASMTDVIPDVREALRRASDAGLPFWIDRWTACLSPDVDGCHAAFPTGGWFHPVTRRWKAESAAGVSAKGEPCLECALFEDCAGYPAAYAEQHGGEHHRPSEAMRRADRLPADRIAAPTPDGDDDPSSGESDAAAPMGADLSEDAPNLQRGRAIEAIVNEALPAEVTLARAAVRGTAPADRELNGDLVAPAHTVAISVVLRTSDARAFTHTARLAISYSGVEISTEQQQTLAAFRDALARCEDDVLAVFAADTGGS